MRIAVFILIGSLACAQDLLDPGKKAEGEIPAGGFRRFSLRCQAGDYFGAAITRRGTVNVAISGPDGVLVRRFRSPGVDGERRIGFAAEDEGIYTIELGNPSDTPSRFALALDAVLPLAERLAPPRIDDHPSPFVEMLRKEVSADGRASAVERFWLDIARRGSPIVEPSGTDGKYQLVTFLWRGRPLTRNVVVLGPDWGPIGYANNSMRKIPDTDVWYLTRRLPSGARFDYRLSINDPLTSDSRASAIRRSTMQADPLNPKRVGCGPDAPKNECLSAVELPGAAPQPWLIKRPGTPAGTIEHHRIHSEIQRLDREIDVYLPPGYRRDGPPASGLLILFDGPEYLTSYSMPATMDNLLAAGKIPATVAVLVSNVGDRRLADLVPNPDFADFLAKELVPWVRSTYNVTADATRTVVGGYSAGGLAAAYLGLRHSAVFGNVLSQSGAVWWAPEHYQDRDPTTETNWIARQFVASPKLPLTFYLEAGTFEADRAGEGGDILEGSRHLRDVLLAKGYLVHYHQFAGGHDGLSWPGTLANGLMALLGSK